MYQYTFDDTTTEKLNQTTQNSKTILEQFADVDNKYNSFTTTAQNLDLEKMEYTKPTKEQVESDAKLSLENYKNQTLNTINNNYAEKSENIDNAVKTAKEESEKDKNQIVASYNALKQDAKDDAIKRGLARSSIIVNTLASYDNDMLKGLQSEANELKDTITKYENEKTLLQEQKDTALSAFDIEYAVKLQDKINEINTNIQKKEQEVIEYNNKIAEKLANWQKEQDDAIFDKTMDIADLVAKHGIGAFDVLKQNEKYEIAKAHFAQMEKGDAIGELKYNSAYKSQLGSALYNKLLNELESR